jgi:hypothetical protein
MPIAGRLAVNGCVGDGAAAAIDAVEGSAIGCADGFRVRWAVGCDRLWGAEQARAVFRNGGLDSSKIGRGALRSECHHFFKKAAMFFKKNCGKFWTTLVSIFLPRVFIRISAHAQM